MDQVDEGALYLEEGNEIVALDVAQHESLSEALDLVRPCAPRSTRPTYHVGEEEEADPEGFVLHNHLCSLGLGLVASRDLSDGNVSKTQGRAVEVDDGQRAVLDAVEEDADGTARDLHQRTPRQGAGRVADDVGEG